MPNLVWQHNTLIQLTVIASAIGSQIVNVFHFECTEAREAGLTSDALAQAEAGVLADDWISNVYDEWLACHHAEYVVGLIKAQTIERPNNFRHKLVAVERPQTTGNVGTVAGSIENAAVCIVARWRTPQAGKSSRGRSYIGPPELGAGANGVLATSARAPYTAFATAMRARYSASVGTSLNWKHTIYSRPYNMGEYQYPSRKTGTLAVVTPPDYAGNSTNVTDFAMDWTLRSQRRRTLGVGA